MIDTHTHPYLQEFEEGGAEAVKHAIDAGVTHMVLPNVDTSTIGPMMNLHRLFPEKTSVAMGLHPTEVGEDWEETVVMMENLLENGDFCAVGEVGLDLYWDATGEQRQREAFRRQLQIAERLRLPVIIHCREALEQVLEEISEVKPTVPLLFHSFTGGPEEVRKIREVADPMFGINGVVTFKNAASLREALPQIGIDRIVLETDAPYLAPVPHRGKRNEPAYITSTCRCVAATLGMTYEEVERITDSNAREFFHLSQ